MGSNKKYWKGIEELKPNSQIIETIEGKEFSEEIPVDEFLSDKESLEHSNTTRRDFLKYLGFSTAAAALAACEGPVQHAIPYVIKPEEITPSVADFYATSINNGNDFASILVKNREGRPIKIEANTMAKVNGCTNARVQASILSLYDAQRMKEPSIDGEVVSWNKFNRSVAAQMDNAQKKIMLLTPTLLSPSSESLIGKLKNKYKNFQHIVYDAVSSSAALDAFEQKYGIRALPSYDFYKADVIVSFGADILGDWQGGDIEKAYSARRNPKGGKMSRHIQIESNMSLSGANADWRIPLKFSEQVYALINLYNILSGGNLTSKRTRIDNKLKGIAEELKLTKGNCIVTVDGNDRNLHLIGFAINELLGSKVMNINTPRYLKMGDDNNVNQMIQDMLAGKVDVLISSGANPAYTLPNANEFKKGLKQVETFVCFSEKEDETLSLAGYKAAKTHFLESWGDAMPVHGHYSLMQPVIKRIFNTRQFEECVIEWLGSTQNYHEYVKSYWKTNVLSKTTWNQALHDGVFVSENTTLRLSSKAINLEQIASNIKVGTGTELILYSKIGMGDGTQANNPWLQELPDPITRTTWDNYITISAKQAKELNLNNWNESNGALNGDKANITVNGITLKDVPMFIQPGQAYGTLGLAFGYGRDKAGKTARGVGVNAYPFYQNFNATQFGVKIEKSESNYHEFACVQLHNTLMGRGDIVRETTLADYINKPKSEWNPSVELETHKGLQPVDKIDLWDAHDRSIGHHFKLSIDLNACTGCGSCVIACHAENNVPVTGKQEVRNGRDMHWLRIDRYYSSEDTFKEDVEKKNSISGLGASLSGFGEMENPSDNPQVVFQPVMCQHCNHAPCETVCPVAATSHGKQGQNQMAYNRCVGTRYCANNCPYKVRRFNWFNYSENDKFDFYMNDDLGRMVLNPDVVVRSRGVMEKCSFCIQITQSIILKAKKEKRRLTDDDLLQAVCCASACSSDAMVFGDINDRDSIVSEKEKDDRRYYLLEHVGTKPNVMYQAKVRNIKG